jgi:hypothetical protein
MLVADRIRADAFDVSADPDCSAIAPSKPTCLHNISGYTPEGWTEART